MLKPKAKTKSNKQCNREWGMWHVAWGSFDKPVANAAPEIRQQNRKDGVDFWFHFVYDSAAVCLNDSSFFLPQFPRFFLSWFVIFGFRFAFLTWLFVCVAFDGSRRSAFISIKCKSRLGIFPIERRSAKKKGWCHGHGHGQWTWTWTWTWMWTQTGTGTKTGTGNSIGFPDSMALQKSWNVFHASLRFVFRHAKSSSSYLLPLYYFFFFLWTI